MARILLIVGVVVAALPVAATASANSASAVMEVSLVVEPSCRASATPLAFSGRAGAAMDAASDIQVTCNDDTPVTVRLDGGLHANGAGRQLSGAGGEVAYAVYSDPSRSLLWAPDEAITGVAGAKPLALSAYGRIDGAATIGALGSYRDSITITVDF